MSKGVLIEEEKIRIPTKLAERLRRIAPDGEFESLDAYATSLLEEVLTQLRIEERKSKKYIPYTSAELGKIREQIRCFSLYP